jgi:hypothetical protein
MADILLDLESFPLAPAAGKGLIFLDGTAGILMTRDAVTGRVNGFSMNAALVTQNGFAADTYVTNSDILIPSVGLQTKTNFRWRISASKTAAGVAAPVYNIRIGSLRTTADASARAALAGPAQTAIADIGTLNVLATVRNIGAAGIIQATAWWDHTGTAASSTGGTGFANDSSGHVQGASAAFDNTAAAMAGLFVGLTVNGGASAAWTVTQCVAEANW